MSTGIDISGRHARDYAASFRTEVLARYPRLNLASEFSACFEDQSRRKPGTRADELWRRGARDRIAANPLDDPIQSDDPAQSDDLVQTDEPSGRG
jgi:hypothetical protein